ncbi:uncharacterized protein LOC111276970 isoform X2 [Durio zibethinus]|uniref:tRNA (guanine(46)-N(7))-methyltransferase n=1 Tax=Durio zibethinus TaxID=66656 RepID=A0A6P5WT56_DURZI|nr:uncharacterized protein LOC111276970 isoform X2 [Durio zibethinus]
MASSICLHGFGVPRAAKEALSSLILHHKFISSIQSNYCFTRAFASSSVSITADKELRSPDLVALEYAGLNLTDKISQELGHVRIRQHVNPLSSSFSVPAPVPDWSEVFRDPTLPLMVDIGSGSGRFLMWLAKQNPDSQNYLGLEIRAKLVKRAEFWVKELALSNIHFIFANATVSFKQLVSTYPGPLMLVSILVFIQSDVLEVAVDMRKQFDSECGALQHIDMVDPSVLCDDEGWLLNNPMGIRTEREIHAEFEGAKVYRRLYQKSIVLN